MVTSRAAVLVVTPPCAADLDNGSGTGIPDGGVTIDALAVDGRPVSMQIILRCGGVAFTWKTAFDEKFQDFSPGMLLLEDYTTSFLADEAIDYVDSCAQDDSGFMAVWSERQGVAEILCRPARALRHGLRRRGGAQAALERRRSNQRMHGRLLSRR